MHLGPRPFVLANDMKDGRLKTIHPAITRDSDVTRVVDVLARGVGIRGIFSDWAATVTCYANCMGIN